MLVSTSVDAVIENRPLPPQHSNSRKLETPNKPEEVDTVDATSDTTTATIVDDSSPTEQTDGDGVIRLLQEGHFEGVAAVRLRINHHEELLAAQIEEQNEALNAGTLEISSSVSGNVETFLSSNELTEEQSAAIQDALGAFISGSSSELPSEPTITSEAISALTTEHPDTVDNLAARFKASFDSLLSELTSILIVDETGEADGAVESIQGGLTATSATESTVTEESTLVATEENTNEHADAFSEYLDSLQGLFDIEFTSLLESVNEIDYLTVNTEPQGNGVSYDKFMAIYAELQTGEGSTDSVVANSLDISA